MATLGGKKLSQLRVVDLRAELEKRGLDKSGLKNALVERLEKVIMYKTFRMCRGRGISHRYQLALLP